MDMIDILISNKPTHVSLLTNDYLKVFKHTAAKDDAGLLYYTAEIMTGPSKGLWTTVFSSKIRVLSEQEVKAACLEPLS